MVWSFLLSITISDIPNSYSIYLFAVVSGNEFPSIIISTLGFLQMTLPGKYDAYVLESYVQ
jgi:hypothetical protein